VEVAERADDFFRELVPERPADLADDFWELFLDLRDELRDRELALDLEALTAAEGTLEHLLAVAPDLALDLECREPDESREAVERAELLPDPEAWEVCMGLEHPDAEPAEDCWEPAPASTVMPTSSPGT